MSVLRNGIALVTGSTSGIGLGIARAFAKAGADVMLHGWGDPSGTARTRAELATECGVRVGLHDADLRPPAEVARLVADTERQLGNIDIPVDNAGVQFVSSIEECWTAR